MSKIKTFTFVTMSDRMFVEFGLAMKGLSEKHNITINCHQAKLKDLVASTSFPDIDFLVTPGNSIGEMSGGFDQAVVQVMGEQIEDSVRASILRHYHGDMPVGIASAHSAGRFSTERIKALIYAPTMRAPKTLPQTSDVPYTTTWAALCCADFLMTTAAWPGNKENPNAHMVLTGHGHGTGGIHPARVAKQMCMAIDRFLSKERCVDLAEMQQLIRTLETG